MRARFDFRKLDLEKVIGKQAASSFASEIFYDRYKHCDSLAFKKDHRWFASHPRQQRFIRPALIDEFNQSEAFFECLGARVDAPQLWVMVHRRLGGQQHFVEPVYRGSCFWPESIDKQGFMVPDDRKDMDGKWYDDEGNALADDIRYRMHLQSGRNMIEQYKYCEAIEQFLRTIEAGNDGQVH